MFDDFDAPMHCPLCGHVSSSSEYIGMQTKLRGDRDGSTLRIGYQFKPNDLRTSHIESAGYLLILPPVPEDRIRLLNTWSCPSCETEQWGLVEIVDGKLTGISAVPMNGSIFHSANFIAGLDAEFLAAALLNMPSLDFLEQGLDPLAVLRERLT